MPAQAITDYLSPPRYAPLGLKAAAMAKHTMEAEGSVAPCDDNMGHGTSRERKLVHACSAADLPRPRDLPRQDVRVPRVATTRSYGTLPTQQYVSARGASARRQESARLQAESARLKEEEHRRRMKAYREIRFGSVSSRVVAPGSARPDSSRAGDTTSVASVIASSRLARQSTRTGLIKAPSIAEIQQAIKDRPHLTARIQALHRDAGLSKEGRLLEIGRIIREVRPDTLHTAPTELEKRQSGYACSAAQKAGRRAATQEHVKRVKEANKKRHSQPKHNHWRTHGGEWVEDLLGSVDLIDARFLVSLHEHGGTLPCWNVLPDAARITPSSVWRLWGWQHKASLPVLALSTPWLDADHPDREGETLASLAPILRVLLGVCGGDEYTIGVLWDYASLPQPIRSPAEHGRFVDGLRSLTLWYSHPYTHVLLMSREVPLAAPGGGEYTNTRSYASRGWCELERRVASLATVRHCLWDLSQMPAAADAALAEGGGSETGAAQITADMQALLAMRAFDRLRSQLTLQQRAPPVAPNAFAYAMRKKVEAGQMTFLEARDLDTVLEMYEAGFVSLFENYRRADPMGALTAFSNMQWGAAEAKTLATTFAYAAEKCKLRKAGTVRLRLEGNDFGEKGEKAIRNAVQFSKVFADVKL